MSFDLEGDILGLLEKGDINLSHHSICMFKEDIFQDKLRVWKVIPHFVNRSHESLWTTRELKQDGFYMAFSTL